MSETIQTTKRTLLAGVLSALLTDAPVAQESTINFTIPPQAASAALITFGEQAGVTVLVDHSARDVQINGLSGRYTPEQAIGLLLDKSGLSYQRRDGAIIVKLQEPKTVTANNNERAADKKQKNSLFVTFMAAATSIFAPTFVSAQDGTSATSIIEEIVVTATKRSTSLQDTAMAISAFSGDTLETLGYSNVRDFIETVPGVTSVDQGPGETRLVIRNVGNSMTREGNLTTSRYVDDFPLIGEGADLKLLDMHSVEVLKGPQGTLYGKAAMGGTVRYLTNKPSTDGIEGGLNASLSQTGESDDQNYSVDGYINIPLSDKLAARAVAYHYKDRGFIDSQPITGLGMFAFVPSGAAPGELLYPGADDYNDIEYTGGRVALRYEATEDVTLDFTYITQDMTSGGRHAVQPTTPYTSSNIDDLESATPIGNAALDTSFKLFNLTLNANFDNFDLVMAAASTESKRDVSNDETLFLFPNYDFPGLPSAIQGDAEGETAEIRLVSNSDNPISWIAGIYYEDFSNSGSFNVVTDSARAIEIFGFSEGMAILASTTVDGNRESAYFGEVGYEFSEQWAATVGYRRSDVSQYVRNTSSGGLFGDPGSVGRTDFSKEEVETWKALLEFRPTSDVLLFALATSGYRAGGKNPTALGNPGNPYFSDSLWNYELGARTTWLDGRLTANVGLYRLEWEDMQLSTTLAGGSVEIANLGAATITGIESELRYQINSSLSVGFNFNVSEGKLSEDYNPTLNPASQIDSFVGDEGFDRDRLPGSAEESYSLDISWQRPLSGGMDIFAHLNHRYVGERTIYFNDAIVFGDPNFVSLPSYNISNLTLGMNRPIGNDNVLRVALYADNLTDERAQRSYLEFYSNMVFVNKPRTAGLRLRLDF